MGIKENFTQAVKELTGIGGKDNRAVPPPNLDSVEGLKKAVGDAPAASQREITLDTPTPDWAVPDWDGSESSTVRPIPKQPSDEPPANVAASASPAESFLAENSGTPVSLLGQQTEQRAAQSQIPAQPAPQGGERHYRQNPAPSVASAQSTNAQNSGQGNYWEQPQSPPPRQSFNPPQRQQPSPSMSSASRLTGMREDNELTVISRNTLISGNIRSFADMSVDGEVEGNIETSKNIDLNGKVVGNISCNNAMMHSSQIQGNVRMSGSISMKRDTLLMGDLMSTYAEINGKVKGNLDIVGKADLKGDAVVFGDISASTVSIEDGAIIQGYLNTTFLNKEESNRLFPDAVVIGTDSENESGF